MQRDLMTGGYDRADCDVYASKEVAAAAQRNLDDNTGFLARLGWSDEALTTQLEAAKQGSAFLLVYAPIDTDAARDECHSSRAVRVCASLPTLHDRNNGVRD